MSSGADRQHRDRGSRASEQTKAGRIMACRWLVFQQGEARNKLQQTEDPIAQKLFKQSQKNTHGANKLEKGLSIVITQVTHNNWRVEPGTYTVRLIDEWLQLCRWNR